MISSTIRSIDSRSIVVALIVALVASNCSSGDGDASSPTSSVETVTTREPAGSGDDGTTTTSTATPTSTTVTTQSEPVDAPPAAFWAIDDLSLDLVLVDTGTGEVQQRILGWGANLGAPPPEGGRQVLTEVEPAGDIVWVADCCEPAVGNVHGVRPETNTPVPRADIRISGTSPVVSPDGSLLAVQVLDFGVAIVDATSGEQRISPELVDGLLIAPAGASEPFFPRPLTWTDDDTLAIAISAGEATTMTFVNVADPETLEVVGASIDLDGYVTDAAMRADGAIVIAVDAADGETVAGLVYDVATGEQRAAVDLPERTDRIDYDPSGTFLLASTTDGLVRWIGLGEANDIADSSFLGAAWADGTDRPAPTENLEMLEIIDRGELDTADIDPVGGCSFYRNGVPGETIFFSSIDGQALAVIDGQPTVFTTEDADDIGPFTAGDSSATYRAVSESVPSSIESNERSATLVITPPDGADEIIANGIMWCGV